MEEQRAQHGQCDSQEIRDIDNYDGHIIFHDDAGHRILLDTGSPVSFGRHKKITILGDEYPVTNSKIGRNCDSISEKLGSTIDALLGMNILQKYVICVQYSQQKLQFSRSNTFLNTSIPMTQIPLNEVWGIPVVDLQINNGNMCQAFVDTGAKISYAKANIVEKYPVTGSGRDFYDHIGHWTTNLHSIPCKLTRNNPNNTVVDLEIQFGVLPKVLEKQLLQTNMAIMGCDLWKKFPTVIFDFPQNKMFLQ